MTTVLWLGLMLGAVNAYDDLFEQANAAYWSKEYVNAARGYERLIADGVVDPIVFHNLGNTYVNLDRKGEAIANYERALQLQPGLRATQDALDKILERTKRKLEKPLPPEWEQGVLFWHYQLPYPLTRGLAMLLWLAFWTALGLRAWRPYPYSRSTLLVLLALAAAFATSTWMKAHPTPLAVAVDDTVPVRYDTSDSAAVRFDLFEGDRVTVDRRQAGWARVTTVGGERGWAPEKSLAFVGPPYETFMAERTPPGGDKAPAQTGESAT